MEITVAILFVLQYKDDKIPDHREDGVMDHAVFVLIEHD